ncbi:MAG: ferrous iron transport protein A [Oscillospiraceae bacterium]|nr:ferrous iron transport protein A [Oscillospiraceae bacterium]
MYENITALSLLPPGRRALVRELTLFGAMRRRLRDLGFIGGAAVECLGRGPSGDPTAYLVRGAVIALRRADAAGVLVEACPC